VKLAKGQTIKDIDDAAAAEYHISKSVLMENAGRTVAMYISKTFEGNNSRICIFCGKGNNGGDGFVAARHLSLNGYKVNVVLIGEESEISGEALENLLALKSTEATMLKLPQIYGTEELYRLEAMISGSDIIVDAILGTGFKGQLKTNISDVIRLINNAKIARGKGIKVISVDVPTGLEADTGKISSECVHADATITFALVKRGMILYPGNTMCGQIVIDHIGIPKKIIDSHSNLEEFTDLEYINTIFPQRACDGHKGTFGKVLTVAGCLGMMGGASLCSMAILKTGTGLSYLATCKEGCNGTDSLIPEVVKILLETTCDGKISGKGNAFEKLINDINNFDSMIVGPGLGCSDEIKACVKKILEKSKIPLVLDADGLNVFEKNLDSLKDLSRSDMVITPHLGEFSRLFNVNIKDINESRTEWAKKAAFELGCVVVLKGSKTVVAHPDGKAYINSTGNDGMATAGSGDVLSGIIASFMGQGIDAFNSAVLGVFIHGLAGDLAALDRGHFGMLARDIIEFLPVAIMSIENNSDILNTLYPVKRFGW